MAIPTGYIARSLEVYIRPIFRHQKTLDTSFSSFEYFEEVYENLYAKTYLNHSECVPFWFPYSKCVLGDRAAAAHGRLWHKKESWLSRDRIFILWIYNDLYVFYGFIWVYMDLYGSIFRFWRFLIFLQHEGICQANMWVQLDISQYNWRRARKVALMTDRWFRILVKPSISCGINWPAHFSKGSGSTTNYSSFVLILFV
jgi:hypothetical protein